ncbi:uncharacterized protein [Fopius arisanus]|uniref:MFSD6_3 protein n=1 Tax=Fopius arisanus TaxID=64838 RepID=A0A0C9PK91_9HYME|nr:PREDICTED: uncharacterized protein LOC105270396 [Fopius arisanus]XP_011309593.1 PREDICTED: uncharacterized protein LOC105270396 [Fopius arisanus]
MLLLKSFCRRITKDFRIKELWSLKLIFFVQASTLFVLYPYLTIHMRELGISVEETAIMSAVTPFVAIVMPPIAGLIADRIGNFKILLSLFSSLGGASALLLLLVPIGRATVKYPEQVVMDLGCPGSNGDLLFTMSQMSHPCEHHHEPDIMMRIQSCGYLCRVDLEDDNDLQTMLFSKTYTVKRLDSVRNHTDTFVYHRPNADLAHASDDHEYTKEHRLLRNNEHYKTSIRQLSQSGFFFPTQRLYKFTCSETPGAIDSSNSTTRLSETGEKSFNQTRCEFNEIFSQTPEEQKEEFLTFKSRITLLNTSSMDESERRRRYLGEAMTLTRDSPVKCGNTDERNRVTITVPLVNWTSNADPYKSLILQECSERCIVTAPRKALCSNMNTVIEYNTQLTFWLYLGIRVFMGIISGTAFAMFEGAVIAIVREQKADYGLQRIYGSIGGMISSPLSGLLIDYASQGKEYTDFRPAFYLYSALKIISGGLMLMINLEFKSPSPNVVRHVITVLKNVEIIALLVAVFILGIAWGYLESFLFWLIQDLGGSRSLMGITITVGGIAGIPLLVLSGPIINKIGHANVLFIGFVFNSIRLLGYSLIYNPWLCLIFEAMESVTSSLAFTAAITYAAKLSTTATDTSIQGLLGGLYYGVGKGAGSLIGGYLMTAFGTRPTYQIFAVVCLITGLIYFFFNLFYLKKRPQVEGNDIVKKKPKVQGQLADVIDTTDKNEAKMMEAMEGIENLAFTDEFPMVNLNEPPSAKALETANNAKNLDNIERMPEENKSRARTVNSVDGNRKVGVTNGGFERETNGEVNVVGEKGACGEGQ